MSAELSDQLLELLAPQERFERIRERWAFSSGRRGCDLAYANPYEGPSGAALDAIEAALREERRLGLQYTPYGGATVPRRHVAGRLSRTHGARFGFRDVVLTPGAMAALNVALRATRVDGDANEVLLFSPCWLDYPLYAVQLGMTFRFVPLTPESYRVDLERVAEALSPSTRAVVLTQPGNPTGVVHRKDEIAGLAALLRRHGELHGAAPLLISDECHRDYVDEGVDCPSPVQHYAETAVVYSFGKAWRLQGQRIGFVAVSPAHPRHRELAQRMTRLTRAAGYATPTALMQRALPWLVGLEVPRSLVEGRRRALAEALGEQGYRVAPSRATFFVYAKAPIEDDMAFVERLAARGLLALPSSVFHQRGHLRLSVTGDAAMLERALPILCAARREALA